MTNLSTEQLDVYEQLVTSSMMVQIRNEKIYISEAKSELYINHFSSLVQKYMEEKKLPIVFAIGEFDGSISIVGKSTQLVVHIGSVLSSFENGGGNATFGKKKN